MSFPLSPTNGQQATVNNVLYQYDSTNNSWTRITTNINFVTAGFTGTTDSTNTTSGTIVVSGGAGVAGNVYANGIYTNGLYYAANGLPISFSAVPIDQYARNTANSASSNTVVLAGVDALQNTYITNALGLAAGAELLANTAYYNTLQIQSVDLWQNTRITDTNNYASGAYNKANIASANTIITQGVDDWQNTQITYVNTFAQSAYDRANTGASNTTLTHSNTVNGIPLADTLLPGEPSINLNDGRLYIQLNNGDVVDISTTPVGNTWYVNGNGNDSFVGNTPSAAKKTIAAAVASASPGDDVIISGGLYIENTPIVVPQNVSIRGSGERSCLIQPADPTKDIFWMNNNGFITGVKFVNYTSSAVAFPDLIERSYSQATSTNTITLSSSSSTYTNYYKDMQITLESGSDSGDFANIISYSSSTKVATIDKDWTTLPTSNTQYSIRIPLSTTPQLNKRYSTYITASPYVFTCSSITNGGTGLKVDGSLATGNKSIIAAQFTQVNTDGKGFHVLNDGYSQLVSIYAIFCDTAFLAESGGTASMGNCNVNFGNKGLVANGKGSLAMSATISDSTSTQASFTANLNNIVANSSFVSANTPYVGLIMEIDGDEPGIYYSVVGSTPISGGNTTVTLLQSLGNTIPSGTTVNFYQQSQLRASGQTFEYVGSGTATSVIPRRGGVANSAAQIITIGEGAVFATATDEQGNFSVSDLTINQATSTISGRTFTKSLFAQMTPYILAIEG
jgi:hypothetical protein